MMKSTQIFKSQTAANKLIADFGCIRLVRLPVATGVIGVEMNTQAKGRNKYNLMNHEFFDNMHNAFDHITNELGAEARAAVLYSTPVGSAHFSAGLDLKSVASEFMGDASLFDKAKLAATVAVKSTTPPSMKGPAFPAMKQMELRRVIAKWQDGVSCIARCRVPVIGVLSQTAYGGAMDVASACDIRVASQTAKMTVQEVRVGITADIGTLQRLPTIVGQGIVREWSYTGRLIKPDEALRTHFVNHVEENDAAALAKACSIAAEIAKEGSPLAVQGTKEVLNHTSERVVQDGLDYVRGFNSSFLLNEDMVAAALNFITKSKESPKWSGHVISTKSTMPTSCVKTHKYKDAKEASAKFQEAQAAEREAEEKEKEKAAAAEKK